MDPRGRPKIERMAFTLLQVVLVVIVGWKNLDFLPWRDR
jgi:hypothetical protein